MASPPRNDAWTPYDDVRFVLVQREDRALKPFRGLVLDEKVIDNRLRALLGARRLPVPARAARLGLASKVLADSR